VYLLVGSLLIFLGITGFSSKSKQGRRLANLLGENRARLLNIIIGIGFVIAGFFL